ncbi:MAG: DUF484 family protein [Methylophilaceae bacterium]
MQEDEIAAYLKDNPVFFEKNASLLADIHLPSPHGDGAISLAERQQLAQRDKIDALQERFAELVLNAEENDAIANKVHGLNVGLHQANDFDAIKQFINMYLPENFNLNGSHLSVWTDNPEKTAYIKAAFGEVSEETKTWITAQDKPYCGAPPEIADKNWFVDTVASMAVIPLKGEACVGFLALASNDKNHFNTDMGKDFVIKIGEIVSAAISRYL